MKKTLATYLSNVLWVYLYWDSEEIKTVDPKFIDRVIGTIEKSELELVNLGVTDAALGRIITMCQQIVEISRTNPDRLPDSYKSKISKIIFATPHKI